MIETILKCGDCVNFIPDMDTNCNIKGRATSGENALVNYCDKFEATTIENVNHPICPINLYFEGDEDKCNVLKCDWDTESRSCHQGCSDNINKYIGLKQKPTNPKDALGVKKVPLHAVPCGPLLELGLAMMEGGRKYGTHNYRAIGTRASTYYNAAMRHLIDWWEGEDIDPDSGIHHLVKVTACMFVVRDSMLMGNWEDDRPIKYPDGLNMSQFNEQAAKLIEKYPNCVNPFIEKSKK